MSNLPVAPTGNVGSCTNQYMVSASLSSMAPMHLALALKEVPSIYLKVVNLSFPLVFSITPISLCSVEPIRMFKASIYSPLGTSRSSTTLFILPNTKFLVRLVIFYFIHLSRPRIAISKRLGCILLILILAFLNKAPRSFLALAIIYSCTPSLELSIS